MPKFSANITFLYREHPLPERFAAARASGFTAVEILTPENVAIPELAAAAQRAAVQVVLCNAPMGDFLAGGTGLSAVPGREAEFREAIESACEWASAFDCPRVHIGPSRVPSGQDRNDCMAVFAKNLSFAADRLASSGIMTLIEPLNTSDMPDICLSTVSQALQVMDEVSHPDIRLQFDVYHAARMEPDLMLALEQNLDRIGHIQFADVPGRGAPGSGKLPFDQLFSLVDGSNYDGWMGAEYLPSGPTESSLGWFEPYRHASL